MVLNKLDAVAPENAEAWAKALQKVPGIAAIVGFSKEELGGRSYGQLKVGKEALIDPWLWQVLNTKVSGKKTKTLFWCKAGKSG